jgi:hypothetical protein
MSRRSQKQSNTKILDLETTNPVLTEYLEVVGEEVYDWFDFDLSFESRMDAGRLRQELVKRYTWAIPNEAAIRAIVSHSPIVEIGAGRGYWAKLIADAGGDIMAFDLRPPVKEGNNEYHNESGVYAPIRRGGATAVREHADRTLLLCWPPYDTRMAYNAVKHYTGTCVIYIGEAWGGCTADDDFHRHMNTQFDEVEEISIPQWPYIKDAMWIYRRK